MPLSINDAGTWRSITEVHVNDAGTWRPIQEIYVNDAGTWRSVFTSESITLSDTSVVASSTTTNATAIYQIANDGDIDGTAGTNTVVDIGDWITPKTNMANYEVRLDVTSGSLSSGTTGSWQACSTSRTWTVTRPTVSGSGTSSATATVQIRRASDSVVMATATITFSAVIP